VATWLDGVSLLVLTSEIHEWEMRRREIRRHGRLPCAAMEHSFLRPTEVVFVLLTISHREEVIVMVIARARHVAESATNPLAISAPM